MLQYSIKHKPSSSIFMDAMEKLRSKRELQHQQAPIVQQHQQRGVLTGPFVVPLPWTKEQFSRFVSSVCADFEVQTLVCPSHEKETAGKAPINIWELVYINELYRDTQFDSAIGEPIIFTVRNRETNQLFSRCPKTVRKLTQEEMSYVDAQNQSPSFP